MLSRFSITTEPDEDGFHAIVIDTADDSVFHITDSYESETEAAAAAEGFLRRTFRQPA